MSPPQLSGDTPLPLKTRKNEFIFTNQPKHTSNKEYVILKGFTWNWSGSEILINRIERKAKTDKYIDRIIKD